MRKSIFILFIGILTAFSSCRNDFETVPSSGKLEFSKKTVYLDTVFSSIGSSTYTLKVYNRSNKDIHIPTLQLAKADSKYRMLVDGMTGVDGDNNGVGDGKVFKNVELLAKDSLFIFIETTANIADTETDYTYNDQIVFDSGSNEQRVNLVTLIQDATFIYPNRPIETGIKETLTVLGFEGEQGHTLTDAELHWTNEKPYVIYGYAAVPSGKTLIIDKGARVYFHANSGLIVDDGATLTVNGEVNNFNLDGTVATQNEVRFEGDRLEPDFEDVPGQWGTILIFSGTNNTINHLTLKNATYGFFMQRNVAGTTPKLDIQNSQIYGCSNVGILGRTAHITGKNNVLGSAGQASLACSQGGTYDFTHCTFYNAWNSTSQLAVNIDDYYAENNVVLNTYPLTANFKNCILYGTNNIELYLDKKGTAFDANFNNCLIKFYDSGTLLGTNTFYNFLREGNSNGNVRNKDPKFYKPYQNKLNISATSPAVGIGNPSYLVPTDILNLPRNAGAPDVGAYTNRPFPE